MDNSPMLQQPNTLSPMLGGTRRPVECPYHNDLCIRDLFGQPICLQCVELQSKFRALQESGYCPNCGHSELDAYGTRDERWDYIIVVTCEECWYEDHAPVVWLWTGDSENALDGIRYGAYDYEGNWRNEKMRVPRRVYP